MEIIMRKTKVICTIGPASQNAETLMAMYRAGMNVARLNLSHGTYEEQQNKIDLIKETRAKMHCPIPIMLDTKGPEYRIGTFENGKIQLKDNDIFTFTTEKIITVDGRRIKILDYNTLKKISKFG